MNRSSLNINSFHVHLENSEYKILLTRVISYYCYDDSRQLIWSDEYTLSKHLKKKSGLCDKIKSVSLHLNENSVAVQYKHCSVPLDLVALFSPTLFIHL